ncbi:hypothetical protein BDV97DRAFT_395086 [Delphinella strobiligena]|nr:hypothetical protein BDV97DRAFT_395086 [Delphinella strobiligena]
MSIFAIFALYRAVAGSSPTVVTPGGHQDTTSNGSKRCPHPNFRLKSQPTVKVSRDTNPEFTSEELAPAKNSKGCPHPHFKLKSQATVQLITDIVTGFITTPPRKKKQARVSRPLETNDSDNYFRGRDMRPMIPFQRKERLMEDPTEYHAPRRTDVYNPSRGRNMKLTPAQRIAVNARAAANERQAYLEALNAPSPDTAPYASSEHDSSSSGSSFDYRLGQKEEEEEAMYDDDERTLAWMHKVEEVEEDEEHKRILAWIHAVED